MGTVFAYLTDTSRKQEYRVRSHFLKMMHPGFPRRTDTQYPMPNEKPQGERIDDLMTKIDAEIQRLGWAIPEAREHLIKCYGKRSRLMLTEEELDNFLLYLQLTDTPPPNT
ncbi:MAG: hypothetical protein V7K90_04795 [Nostoc sp.]|uniref:hypothetical protein n=1 Tax=Nostoc sp. TaxID=1180 RepID=UPI002FF71106